MHDEQKKFNADMLEETQRTGADHLPIWVCKIRCMLLVFRYSSFLSDGDTSPVQGLEFLGTALRRQDARDFASKDAMLRLGYNLLQAPMYPASAT